MAKLINRDLFDLTRTHSFEEHASLAALVRERIGSQGLEEVDIDNFLTQFRKAAKKKWHSAGCHIRNMESKFGTPAGWLNQVVDFGGFIVTSKRKATPKKGVAPKKEFGNLSRSQQNRSTANLRAENESSKLLHAAKTALRNDGKEDMAVVIEEASKSPTRPSKIRRLSGIASSLDKAPPRDLALPTKISDDDALAHLFYTDMTRDAYVANRLMCKSHGADIWPPYGNLQEAKKLCRPANITYEECAVIVPLRERLLHNDGRFVQVFYDQIEEHLQNVEDGGTLTIEVEEKIGFDGSTGNSIYNQKFGSNDPEACEESLLSTCLVPLQYRTSNGQVIFTNPVPQGVTFCQPVRLEYKKETQAASKQIDNWIDAEVAALAEDPIIIPYATKFLKFLHTLRKTMMDVKAKNAVTDTLSTLRCFLCGASSSSFNNIEKLVANYPTKEENLVYGSVCDLHAWLRAFDAVNSLSDKLSIKKWKIASDADRKKVESRKKRRNAAYLQDLNLVVDMPRSGGSGNSNTGNVARKAFQNEEAFARITGVDVNLIHDIHTLLIAINVDLPLDVSKLKAKGLATVKRWVELYGWYNMPVTLHQLFFHAWESLRLSSLPLGFFSEQSLESTNKYFKSDRLHHSRKDSRLHTIQDQFHRQSDKSDISMALKLQEKQKKKRPTGELPRDVLELLIPAQEPDV